MDYQAFEERLVESYRKVADRYRGDDEIEICTENHQRVCGNLRRISSSFGRKIRVLDVGCGTGRHFHCLRNVQLLVGVDISPEMLRTAGEPVRKQDVSAEEIQLLRENVYDVSFPSASFDFIYSLGLFGYGAPLTLEMCRKFYEWLGSDGRLYLDAIEISNVRPLIRARKKLKKLVYPLLPRSMQRILDERENHLPFFALTHKDLEELMRASGFSDFVICSNVCRSPLWKGVHLECVASKGSAPGQSEPRRGTRSLLTAYALQWLEYVL